MNGRRGNRLQNLSRRDTSEECKNWSDYEEEEGRRRKVKWKRSRMEKIKVERREGKEKKREKWVTETAITSKWKEREGEEENGSSIWT